MWRLTAKQCLPVSQALKIGRNSILQHVWTSAPVNQTIFRRWNTGFPVFLGRSPTGRGIAAFLDERASKSKTRKLRRRSCELIGASVHKEQTVTLGTAECDGKKINLNEEMSHRCDAGERLENILEDRVSRRAAPLRSLVRREGTVILCDLSRE